MAERDNSFSLFRNDRKQNDKHPDYTGHGLVRGAKVRVSGWLNTSKSGQKYMSCRITFTDEPQEAGPPPAIADADAYEQFPF